MLALPMGMAAGTGWIPALSIILILAMASGYTFSLVGWSCFYTKESDFKSLWSHAFGHKTAYVLEAGIGVLCFLVVIIYAGIIGDVFTPILHNMGLPEVLNHRWLNICIVSAGILLPLSLLENLSSLAFTSFLGVLSVLYTLVFMTIRAFDGSYIPGAAFLESIDEYLRPAFESESLWAINPKVLVLISNLGLAFIAHYNAPRYFTELEGRSPFRFQKMVYTSFGILGILYCSVAAVGYKTFGDNCASNITLNYASHDILAALGRFATGISILFGFPLTFIGLVDGFIGASKSRLDMKSEKLTLLWWPGRKGRKKPLEEDFSPITRLQRWVVNPNNNRNVRKLLLLVVTLAAASVPDIGLIVGICGSLMGSSICYIVPPLVYYRAVKKCAPGKLTARSWLNLLFIPVGIFLAILGVCMTFHEHTSQMFQGHPAFGWSIQDMDEILWH